MKRSRSLLFLLMGIALLISGCKQELAREEAILAEKRDEEILSITVKNITSRPLYATCFAYIKKRQHPRWRWRKTPVHEVKSQQSVTIPIARIADPSDRRNTFGFLGMFTSAMEAEEAVYELLPDEHKIDLDQIYKLKGQEIVIGVEKYGIKGDIFDYDFIPEGEGALAVPELDFKVENQTGKAVYAIGYIYQKKGDMPVWRYDKTPIIKVANGETGLIDVDSITDEYDRKYMRGCLAIFDEHEKELAEQSTYQLLEPHNKINVGLLSALRDRKVVLKSEQYGIMGDAVDFTIKPVNKIDFHNVTKR